MNKRIANKILSTDNYFEFLVNPENGKSFYCPKTQKHVVLMRRACQKLGDWEPYNSMNALIKEAFDVKD